MHIALSTDDRYSMACGACIASIYVNNPDKEVNVHILTSGLSKVNLVRFKALADRHGRTIDIIKVKDDCFAGLKLSSRFPVSIYYRLLLPRLLECDKVLYMDCDIIVNGTLDGIYCTPMSEKCAGVVVEDQYSDDAALRERTGVSGRYFNSGVILINLDYWRKNQVTEKCITFIHDNPHRCVYPDQDALNHIIGESVSFVEYGYNFQELMFGDKSLLRLHHSKFEMVDKWIDAPVVIHYSGYHKPWFTDSPHPKACVFLYYLSQTPWKDIRRRAYYGLIEKLKRKFHKLKSKLFG